MARAERPAEGGALSGKSFRGPKARLAAVAGALALSALAAIARAQQAPAPPLQFELRDTAEVWRNLQGGYSVGNTTLNKLQASVRFTSAGGFTAYAQVFKTNAESLSLARTGDVQTVSNIEAPDVTRLFEAWAARAWGDEDKRGYVAVRAGLIDLNRTFDSIEPAGLFIHSSHGIGPDLSRSSQTGPSIFPVTGPAAQVDWRPSDRLLAHVGVFGLPDPDRQQQFVDARVSSRNGAVVIGQADYSLGKDAQVSVGVWKQTQAQPSLADPTRLIEPKPGVYGFVEGPTALPGGPSGWLRVGVADGRTQAVAGYLGAGLVWSGLTPARKSDKFGIAVAHAVIGAAGHEALGLPRAETSFEATYSFRLTAHLHLQPDVQHIVHPALGAGIPNATVVGLRLIALGRAPDPPGEDD